MDIMKKLAITSIIATTWFTCIGIADNYVSISKGVKSIPMSINGEDFVLERNQDKNHTISPLYNTTFRGIPQPIKLADGVETVGELEFIEYMKKAQTNKSILIVDSRTPGWYERLRIPGAVNVPYTNFKEEESAYETLEYEFDVSISDDKKIDFSKAKTLVVYCNGYWCPQTPLMIKKAKYSLLNLGYPPQKIKYYRGGMQAWVSLGFTVMGSGK